MGLLTVSQIDSKISDADYVLDHQGNYPLAVVRAAENDRRWWTTVREYAVALEEKA